MPTSIKPVEDALVAWVRSVAAFGANQVYLADQNAPKQSKPFVTIRVTAMQADNPDYIQSPDNGTGASVIIGDRQFTVNLVCTGDRAGATHPGDVLLNLRSSLQVLEKYKILTDTVGAEMTFIDTLMPPTNVTDRLDKEYEPRWAMDLRMGMVWSSTDPDQGVIESTVIDAKYKDVIQGEINNTITVDTTP